MTDRQFFDTNVLIYAFDSSEPAKQQIAVNRIDAAVRTNSGVISTQVLGGSNSWPNKSHATAS